MLPRSQRLSVEQLNSVMEKGRVAHSPFFLMRLLGGQRDTRIAAIAPQKIIKTAVARSATRRKIYNVLRTLQPKVVSGTHIALFAKAAISTAQKAEVEADIKNLFVKARLLR